MFDSKIDNQYRNSRGEFVDIYAEFKLPNTSESTDDEIKAAWHGILQKYHPDVSKDVELALAMTQFANRAMDVLTNERASYDAGWRRARGRKAAPPPPSPSPKTWPSGRNRGESGKSNVPPPSTDEKTEKNGEDSPKSVPEGSFGKLWTWLTEDDPDSAFDKLWEWLMTDPDKPKSPKSRPRKSNDERRHADERKSSDTSDVPPSPSPEKLAAYERFLEWIGNLGEGYTYERFLEWVGNLGEGDPFYKKLWEWLAEDPDPEEIRNFWQRVKTSFGEDPTIFPEYYHPEQGFVFEKDDRLRRDDLKFVDDVEGLTPGKDARKEIGRVARVGDAAASADRAAKILDRLHVDTIVSSFGWVTAGAATIGVSAAAWSHFAYHGVRAGISWEQYFKAAGLQTADAAIGLICPVPFMREAIDMHFRATEISVDSAFPPALVRALERAMAAGIREEDIQAALVPSKTMQEEWDAYVKVLELKIYAFEFLSIFRRYRR